MKCSLVSADQNSNVQAVSGRSAFTLDRDCDGWRSNEEYLIEFGGQEGSRDRILSRFESWESDKGDMYSFEISENSSFEAAKDFGGFAEIKSGGGDAYFSMADEVAVALPADTYFPMRHLNAIIDSAKMAKPCLPRQYLPVPSLMMRCYRPIRLLAGGAVKRRPFRWVNLAKMAIGQFRLPISNQRQQRPHLNMKFNIRCSQMA
jgi:hypothetical protein